VYVLNNFIKSNTILDNNNDINKIKRLNLFYALIKYYYWERLFALKYQSILSINSKC
jgi:hypothetical protein